jgi:hypothetical protein
MKIIIYDALSALRVRMENEPGVMFLRGVVNDTQLGGLRIWVWDGPRSSASRKAIYPAYKSSRVHTPGVDIQMGLVRELLEFTPAWQVHMPDVEGDDVVAALVEYFLRTQPDARIEIMGRDGDLVANCALSPRVTSAHQVKGVQPKHIRLRKLTVGKGSDDIPGVKGFGQGAWDKADKDQLQVLMDQVLAGQNPDASHLMSKASCNWLDDPANVHELRLMKRCIDPMPISDELLNQYLKQGTHDPAALEAKMKEYLL